MVKPFRKVPTGDPILEEIQNNVLETVNDIQRELSYNIVDVTTTSSGDIIVNHGLNRKPVGYHIVRKSAQVDVWDSSTSNPIPHKQLLLNASANATIKLKVF